MFENKTEQQAKEEILKMVEPLRAQIHLFQVAVQLAGTEDTLFLTLGRPSGWP